MAGRHVFIEGEWSALRKAVDADWAALNKAAPGTHLACIPDPFHYIIRGMLAEQYVGIFDNYKVYYYRGRFYVDKKRANIGCVSALYTKNMSMQINDPHILQLMVHRRWMLATVILCRTRTYNITKYILVLCKSP